MRGEDVRRVFLDFFVRHGHTEVVSAPIVPVGDPTLLFTNAGMNQFKNVFLGLEKRPYKRATSCQKCLRVSGKHNDLETVGSTERHHTFFEMLGNFSFGDYFKKEAIKFAWQLLTGDYAIPPDRLYATVYEEDDEAFEIWRNEVGLEEARIWRGGRKDNYWMMGDTGPCGPCSEVHYDRGKERGQRCEHPFCREARPTDCPYFGSSVCPRFFELWNLVFMQFEQHEDGRVEPLPRPSIDTGAGLERLCAVVQGVEGNFQTDLFRPIIAKIEGLCGGSYSGASDRMPYRVVADHIRALVVCISDGVIPSNEGRGYVVRRILRRAVRYLLKLNIHKPALFQLVEPVVDTLGSAYPEIKESAEFAQEIIRQEEENFHRTLRKGLEVFEEAVARARSGRISGSDAFKLYDTYGFPIDLTRILARERGLEVDEAGFESLLNRQRIRSRTATKFTAETIPLPKLPPTKFTGYEELETEATVLHAAESMVVLDRTPFYGEAGGQVGDRGVIEGDGWRFVVRDTKRSGDVFVHYGRFEEGGAEDAVGRRCVARVDGGRRAAIARAHTATHLLHFALRTVVGKHARQAGSLVEPDRLRFDFTHFRALTDDQLAKIERLVNQKIVEDHPVRVTEQPLQEALKSGVIAIFEEKYRDVVRVVSMGDFSRELCGGTHLGRTSQVCLFRIVGEQSVQAGVRRIEAVTGLRAYQKVAEEAVLLRSISEAAGSGDVKSLPQRIRKLREAEKQLRRLKEEGPATLDPDKLLESAKKVKGLHLVMAPVDATGGALRSILDRLKTARRKQLVALLYSVRKGRVSFVLGATADVVAAGFDACEAARIVGKTLGGSGGGRADFAQGGGPNPNRVNDALSAFESYTITHI